MREYGFVCKCAPVCAYRFQIYYFFFVWKTTRILLSQEQEWCNVPRSRCYRASTCICAREHTHTHRVRTYWLLSTERASLTSPSHLANERRRLSLSETRTRTHTNRQGNVWCVLHSIDDINYFLLQARRAAPRRPGRGPTRLKSTAITKLLQ